MLEKFILPDDHNLNLSDVELNKQEQYCYGHGHTLLREIHLEDVLQVFFPICYHFCKVALPISNNTFWTTDLRLLKCITPSFLWLLRLTAQNWEELNTSVMCDIHSKESLTPMTNICEIRLLSNYGRKN